MKRNRSEVERGDPTALVRLATSLSAVRSPRSTLGKITHYP